MVVETEEVRGEDAREQEEATETKKNRNDFAIFNRCKR
jgi:hypothetical protein